MVRIVDLSNGSFVLGELEKPEEAVSDLSRAIAIRPQSSTLYKARARLQGVAGKEDAALADLEKIVELEPDDGESLHLLAWAYANGPVATRRPERAVDLALKAVEISPRGYTERKTLGIAYYRAGNFKKSAEALEEALALEGNGGTAFDFFFLAMSHFKLGEREKADEYYKKALEWDTRQKDLAKPQADDLKLFTEEAEEVLGRKRG